MVTLWAKVFIPLTNWRKSKSGSDGTREDEPEVLDVYISSNVGEINKVQPTTSTANGNPGTARPRRSSTRTASCHGFSDDTPQLTWRDLATIMDKALFKVLSVFILLLTVIVLLALIIGGYS